MPLEHQQLLYVLKTEIILFGFRFYFYIYLIACVFVYPHTGVSRQGML